MAIPDINPASANQWPDASIGELITMCSQPVLIGLGIVPAPGQDTTEVDLPLARHFIDLLALLNDKTEGQLEDTDRLEIDQALHELRMAFVQVQDAQRQTQTETQTETETETETETDRTANPSVEDAPTTPDVESDTTVDTQPDGTSQAINPQTDASDTADTSAKDD
jgi:hypothetical protein